MCSLTTAATARAAPRMPHPPSTSSSAAATRVLLALALMLPLLAASATTAAAAPNPASFARALLQQAEQAPPPTPPADFGGNDTNSNSTAAAAATALPACCSSLPPGFPFEGVPVVVIDTKGRPLPANKSWINGTLCTCGAPGGKDYDRVPIKVRIRGSTSAETQQQKSLAFKTVKPPKAGGKRKGGGGSGGVGGGRDADNATAADGGGGEIMFMGFPRHDSWILYAPEGDKALGLRNWLAYSAARRMGRWASRTRYAEVFLVQDGRPLDRAAHYHGLYIAGEAVARGRARVDVEKFNSTLDPSGGWLLRYENDNTASTDTAYFDAKRSRLTFLVDYPEKPSQTDLEWIERYVDACEAKMLSPAAAAANASLPSSNGSAAAANGWRGCLDEPAAIDYLLGTELTKNPDGYRGSIKLHKRRGAPLAMGPLWDYDEAFGACCGYPIEGWRDGGGPATRPQGWRFSICNEPGRCKVEPLDGISQWYRRLWATDAAFRRAIAARWAALRSNGAAAAAGAVAGGNGTLADAWFTDEIARTKALIAGAADRNFERWRGALADAQYPSWRAQWDAATAELQTWILARLTWMDQALAAEAAEAAAAAA